MRGFTRKLYDRLDLRSTGMEFALEMIIKSAQIGARIAEIPIILWPDKRGRAPQPAEFSRRLAQPAVHAALRAELALPAAGHRARAAGLFLVFGLLQDAQIWPMWCSTFTHDFRRYLHAAGGADPVNRGIRKSIQLCRAL